jgi:hypothetical protein
MTHEERMKVCEELEKYTSQCNDEFQEATDHLIALAGYPDYMSRWLLAAIDVELQETLENYKEVYEFVDEEVTQATTVNGKTEYKTYIKTIFRERQQDDSE